MVAMRKRARFSESCAPVVVRAEDFHSLDCRHPYGVLPYGNRFLVTKDDDDGKANDDANDDANDENKAETTSSSAMTVTATPLALTVNDECWNTILSFLSGASLGRVAQVGRYCYVAAHQPELWRDLVLRRMDARPRGDERTIEVMESSWKDTYARMVYPRAYDNHHDHHYHHRKPHVPIPMPGIFSDFLYRLHECRAFAIPAGWLEGQESSVPRVKQITAEQFYETYENANSPVVIDSGAKEWPAFSKWQDPSYCIDATKGRPFRATSGVAPLPAQFSLESYFTYATMSSLEEAPVYLFDRTALYSGSPLWKDFHLELCHSCPFWDPARDEHDLFKLLGEGKRPDHTWWIVGPRRSGSVFHIDPNATHAWNAAIVGRKRWIFYPPGVTPPGVHPSSDGDSVALPLSVGEWLLTFWEEHCERRATAAPSERPLECTAMPGDVLFIPHGWWHMVINLDEVNIAITHNYVGKSNLDNVLKFLSEKR
jgi:hypothetical protein